MEQKCKVQFKEKEHKGVILEKKMDKMKVQVNDRTDNPIHTDWFESKQIKRIW